MDTWFPLCRTIMEYPGFILSPPHNKVLYWAILSQANLKGEFYRADLEWAVELGMGVTTVRAARRGYQHIGWFSVTPGRKIGGRRLATQYHSVKGAKPPGKGEFFARMRRIDFEVLCHRLRKKELTHRDVVTYIYLCYLRQKLGGRDKFFVSKSELRLRTNLQDAPECVRRIARLVPWLYKFRDSYHKLEFDEWCVWRDPAEEPLRDKDEWEGDEDEWARKLESWRNDLKLRIAKERDRDTDGTRKCHGVGVNPQVSRRRCHELRS